VVRDLDTQVSGLSDLVAELVDLARGTAEPEVATATDLRPLIERAVERTRRIDPSVGVRISGDPVRATVRPGTLERGVTNLVRNAIQASPAGAEVHVEVRRTPTGVRIEVRDRGHGLQPDEVPRVFERFFRGAAARNRLGAGLGLAIVAQAAELHGGVARAARRPGGGARFSLEIPAGRD
jgi:two-component system sensor histidine kinase MprB